MGPHTRSTMDWLFFIAQHGEAEIQYVVKCSVTVKSVHVCHEVNMRICKSTHHSSFLAVAGCEHQHENEGCEG